jgi:uncharacterized protein
VLLTSPNVYVKDTGTPKGRGVFARAGFAGGQVVEVCPVVLLRMPFEELPAGVERLVFNWERLAGVPGTQALALGYGSLYNHDNPANLRYEADETGLLLRLTAVRDIPAGEELTINYNADGGAPVWDDDNWFERMGVEPITRPRPAGRGRRRASS